MLVGEPQLQQHTGLPTRVAVYIDGFNLFYGLRDKGWRRYYWLDLRLLSERLLRPGQTLEAVRYFTARVVQDPSDPGKPERQNTYLDALAALPQVSIHYGYFVPRRHGYEEKMTDVNISVEMLCDAHANTFDTAVLVSADGDLTGVVAALTERYGRRVIVAFPPGRRSNELREAATNHMVIGADTLRNSQLPGVVPSITGYPLTRPEGWA